MYENEIENIASRGTNEEIYYGLLELTKMQRSRGERLRERRNSIISQQSFL